MEDLIQSLSEYALPIVASIFVIVYLVINLFSEFDVVRSFFYAIINLRRWIFGKIYKYKRDTMDKALSDKAYVEWQKTVMEYIYEPLVEICRKNGIQICMTEIKMDKGEESYCHKYEAVNIDAKIEKYPFVHVCPKDGLSFVDLEKANNLNEDIKYTGKTKKLARKYLRWMKSSIRYPKRVGYMLDGIEFDSDGCIVSFSTYTGRYLQNIVQSHIMEFELYDYYKNNSKKKSFISERTIRNRIEQENDAIDNKSERVRSDFYNDLMEKFPIRQAIHNLFIEKENGEWKVLVSGKHRHSLLGVQIFVMLKNKSGSYDALRMRRSAEVVAKAGYLQFIPSGGFEAMNSGLDRDSQYSNYSLSKVLFRELLEECFGFSENINRNCSSPEIVYHQDAIKKILGIMDKCSDNDDCVNGVEFEFLGTSMNLVGLRQELCFILKLDEPEFADMLISNFESQSAINMIDIRKLEDLSYWKSENNNDFDMLNCTSAGLFELVRKSHVYRRALGTEQDEKDHINL